MVKEYKRISADSHVEVPSERWTHRIVKKYRDQAPRTVRLEDGADGTVLGGLPPRQNPMDLYGGKGRDAWLPYGQRYDETPGTGSPKQRLAEQDMDKTDAEVLFPAVVTGPRYWVKLKDTGLQKAIFRGWNDWLAEEYCSYDRERFFGVGVIPATGIDDAVAEVQHCAKLGMHALVLTSFPNGGLRPHPEDDRFWAATIGTNLPVTIHVDIDRSSEPKAPFLDYPVEHEAVLKHTDLAFQVQRFARTGGTNVVQLVLSHLFDRFPGLQVGCLETYLGWVPFFMEMADLRYNRHIHWAQSLLNFEPLKAPPSEIIKQHFYWGFQQDRSGVELRHHMGVDKLMWASDFPHQESDWPDSDRVISHNFKGVPDDEVRQMVVTNAMRFFKITGAN